MAEKGLLNLHSLIAVQGEPALGAGMLRGQSRKLKGPARAAAVFDKILETMMWIAASMAVFMMLAVTYSVIMRYFLNDPPIWVTQVCEYLLLWMTFLAAPKLLRDNAHVMVDVLISMLGKRARSVLAFICLVVGAVVCLIVLWFGIENTWDCWQSGEMEAKVVYLPKAPLMSIIPFGTAFLVIQFVRKMFKKPESDK